MKPKLIICDVGGVLCGNTDVAPAIATFLHLTVEEFYAVMGAGNWQALQSGALSERAFWAQFSHDFGRTVPDDLWDVLFDPSFDEEVAALLRELRRRFRVVAGTNTFASHYKTIERRGWYEAFNAIYASHTMGVAKPDSAFYWHILREEGREPSEAFFIDDAEENVAAARAIELESHLYRDAASLRLDLEERGLIRQGDAHRH